MIENLPTLKQLLKNLQQVPYLASKNLYKVANHFLTLDEQRLEQFCTALLLAKKNIIRCQNCFIWQEKEGNCLFCSSLKRDKSTVCVVEGWQELMAIEKTGGYNGVYHVLGGVVCPLEGIGPENLTIEQLMHRVQNSFNLEDDCKIKEIILAMNQTPEGEATSAYIANKLKDVSVSISCLARGVPVGSSLEFMDRVTLYKAMSERRPF